MNTKTDIGLRLAALRIEAGYKEVKEFAQNHNFSYATYRRWELGEREPNTNDLQALAKIHNVSIDYLLGFESKQTRQKQLNTTALAMAEDSAQYVTENSIVLSVEEAMLINLWRNASTEGQDAAKTVLTAYKKLSEDCAM